MRSSEPILRFGTFELATTTGELRKEGRLIHLRHQPAQVLRLLLEKPGALVTRAEMISALWPDDLDVDVEQGLNHCVKEIRAALSDRAGTPRFIQTFPRRGYRFLAEVRAVRPRGAFPDRAYDGIEAPVSGDAPAATKTDAAPPRPTAAAPADPLGVSTPDLESPHGPNGVPGRDVPSSGIRVQVLLTRPADGAILWSETFDRQKVEAGRLAQDVASGVTTGLNEVLKSTADELAREDDDGLGTGPRFE